MPDENMTVEVKHTKECATWRGKDCDCNPIVEFIIESEEKMERRLNPDGVRIIGTRPPPPKED
jgi:hypothetical protein